MLEENILEGLEKIDEAFEIEKTKERKPSLHLVMVSDIEKKIAEYQERVDKKSQKEAEEVDLRVMFLKLKKCFLEVLGIAGGAESQSNDAMAIAKEIRSKMYRIEGMLECIEEDSNKQKELFLGAIKIIQDANIDSRVTELEDKVNKKPLSLWTKIKRKFSK